MCKTKGRNWVQHWGQLRPLGWIEPFVCTTSEVGFKITFLKSLEKNCIYPPFIPKLHNGTYLPKTETYATCCTRVLCHFGGVQKADIWNPLWEHIHISTSILNIRSDKKTIWLTVVVSLRKIHRWCSMWRIGFQLSCGS